MDNEELHNLISELRNGNAQQRRAASYKLGKSKDPQAISALIAAYNDPDGSVKTNAIEGLRNIGSKEAQEFLISQGQSIQISKSNRPQDIRQIFLFFCLLFIVLIALGCLMASSLSSDCSWDGNAFAFVDENADGKFQEGEPPLPGVTVLFTRVSVKTEELITDKQGNAHLGLFLGGCPDFEIEVEVVEPEELRLTTPAVYRIENPNNEEKFIFGFTYISAVPTMMPTISP